MSVTTPVRAPVAPLEGLRHARERTASLLGPLTDEQLNRQISPLQSPLVWDFAHIGHFEELWLLRELGGRKPLRDGHDEIYDAFAHARSERAELPLLAPADARAFVDDVRTAVVDLLPELPERVGELDTAFVAGMVAQHELQHVETMTQTLQLGGLPGPAGRAPAVAARGAVTVPAGEHALGTDIEAWAYDNERPAHAVELGEVAVDLGLVTNAGYRAFVADGGYRRPEFWSPEGRAWLAADGADAPLYWRGDGTVLRFGAVEALAADAPVQHVSFFEAEAFAAWAGARLPTEAEWEAAARTGELEHAGRSVWEWTASHFGGYPGFRAFPYREYSEVFFGTEYRVLRGGSWVTDPLVARTTFRNWDYPQRRQIFSGIRCARDV